MTCGRTQAVVDLLHIMDNCELAATTSNDLAIFLDDGQGTYT